MAVVDGGAIIIMIKALSVARVVDTVYSRSIAAAAVLKSVRVVLKVMQTYSCC